MNTQHTPGPWKVRNGREVFCGNKRICHVNAASQEPLSIKDELDVAAANARLIAAAPELLEALRGFVEHGTCFDETDMANACAAIAKATGQNT